MRSKLHRTAGHRQALSCSRASSTRAQPGVAGTLGGDLILTRRQEGIQGNRTQRLAVAVIEQTSAMIQEREATQDGADGDEDE